MTDYHVGQKRDRLGHFERAVSIPERGWGRLERGEGQGRRQHQRVSIPERGWGRLEQW